MKAVITRSELEISIQKRKMKPGVLYIARNRDIVSLPGLESPFYILYDPQRGTELMFFDSLSDYVAIAPPDLKITLSN